jgi:hypothetical protein
MRPAGGYGLDDRHFIARSGAYRARLYLRVSPPWFWIPRSPARPAASPRSKQCPPTPASFSTSAADAVCSCGRSRGIAACSAPTARFPARPLSRRVEIVAANRSLPSLLH